MTPNNPFAAGNYNGMQFYHITADDRIRMAKSFGLSQCQAALQVSDLQKTVEKAVRARMRQLEKEAGNTS